MEWRTTVNMRKAHEKKEFGYTIHRAQRGETLSAWMEDVFFFFILVCLCTMLPLHSSDFQFNSICDLVGHIAALLLKNWHTEYRGESGPGCCFFFLVYSWPQRAVILLHECFSLSAGWRSPPRIPSLCLPVQAVTSLTTCSTDRRRW